MTRGRFTLLVMAAALVAVVAVTGLSIDFSGGDHGRKSSSTPTATTGEPKHAENRRREVSKPGANPDVVRGDEEISLTRPRNLTRALAVLERQRLKAEGVFEDLRIAPGRIDTQVRNSRQIINLQVRTDFSIPSDQATDFPGDEDTIANGIGAGDVDVNAPSRILRKIDRRRDGTTAASDLDYMVVDRGLIDHQIEWAIFLKRGPRPRSWRAEGRRPRLTPIG